VLACTPHPGLGTVVVRHVQIDLATCKTAAAPRTTGGATPKVVIVRHGDTGTQSIVFRGRTVLTVKETYKGSPAGSPGPIELEGVSQRQAVTSASGLRLTRATPSSAAAAATAAATAGTTSRLKTLGTM